MPERDLNWWRSEILCIAETSPGQYDKHGMNPLLRDMWLLRALDAMRGEHPECYVPIRDFLAGLDEPRR